MSHVSTLALVCLLCLGSLFSGEPASPSDQAENLLLKLYALPGSTMNAKYHLRYQWIIAHQKLPKDRRADALIFLKASPNNPLDAQTVEKLKHYTKADMAWHIIDLYEEANPTERAVFKVSWSKVDTFAMFLGNADALDGTLDMGLNIPDLATFYTLAIKKGTPTAALCFNCRNDNRWTDRRSLLRVDGWGDILAKGPRKLRKQLYKLRGNTRLSPEQKLNKISSILSGTIEGDTDEADYWQTPRETLARKKGDCEDFAILFHVTAAWMNIPVRVVAGTVAEVGQHASEKGHAWVEYGGKVFDPVTPTQEVRYKPMFRFDSRQASFADLDPALRFMVMTQFTPNGPRDRLNLKK